MNGCRSKKCGNVLSAYLLNFKEGQSIMFDNVIDNKIIHAQGHKIVCPRIDQIIQFH